MTAPDANDPRWAAVDALLFAGSRLQAIQQLRESFGAELSAAIEAIGERFEYLRAHHAAEFRVPLTGYWDGFYS